MLYEYINIFFGIIKLLLYKIIYYFRISFHFFPVINKTFNITIKKGSKLEIGKKLRMRNNVTIRIADNGTIKIGNNCFFNDGCSLNCLKNVTIGDNVICGQNVMIFDHDHDYKNNINEFIKDEINIGNNVWIGANVIILKGVSIGDNVVIAAGTIVKKDIKSNSLVYEKKDVIGKTLRGD